MQFIGEEIPNGTGRETYLSEWLSKDTADDLKLAALSYLGKYGQESDLSAIKSELGRGHYKTTYAAADAIVRISLRISRLRAIRALIELQMDSIRPDLLQAIFEKGTSIDRSILVECLSHRNSEVRRTALSLLEGRGGIDVDTAIRLTSDPDADVRFLALRSLVLKGRYVSDDEAKTTLVKPSQSYGLGMLSGGDRAGEANWKLWRKDRLRQKTIVELEEESARETILDRASWFVLVESDFARHAETLREAVDDQVKLAFANEIAKLESISGIKKDTIEGVKSLEEGVRKELTRNGVDIICRNGSAEDLNRIRRLIADNIVTLSDIDVRFLEKHGEWEDIWIIISALKRRRLNILIEFDDKIANVVARSIYTIAKDRTWELLRNDIPSDPLLRLLALMSDNVFKAFTDDDVIKLCRDESDRVRELVALKTIYCFSKRRIGELRDKYIVSGVNYYYNVVHIFDFGTAVSRGRAVLAAKRAANDALLALI